jgi:hypothetical protein
MRSLATLLLTFICLTAHAEAPSDFSFKELPECSDKIDPYLTPDSLKARRSGKQLVVTVTASRNCSSAIHPTVTYGRSEINIAIEEQFEKDAPIAGCNCMRRFRFALTRPVKPKTKIYLVPNGYASAHTVAP